MSSHSDPTFVKKKMVELSVVQPLRQMRSAVTITVLITPFISNWRNLQHTASRRTMHQNTLGFSEFTCVTSSQIRPTPVRDPFIFLSPSVVTLGNISHRSFGGVSISRLLRNKSLPVAMPFKLRKLANSSCTSEALWMPRTNTINCEESVISVLASVRNARQNTWVGPHFKLFQ